MGRAVEFDLRARDFLLVYFFTTVGPNARISDLVRGGPLLAILLALTIALMFIQNGVGFLGAILWGLPQEAGVLMGTASMIGGHGTAIAWGPVVEQQYNVTGAAELGIASATVGLILASILGGPIARFLIERNKLDAKSDDDTTAVGAETDVATAQDPITNQGLLRSILAIHLAIILGYFAFEALQAAGVKLPLFVPCLLAGILLSNTVPKIFPKVIWPADTPSMALSEESRLNFRSASHSFPP